MKIARLVVGMSLFSVIALPISPGIAQITDYQQFHRKTVDRMRYMPNNAAFSRALLKLQRLSDSQKVDLYNSALNFCEVFRKKGGKEARKNEINNTLKLSQAEREWRVLTMVPFIVQAKESLCPDVEDE